MAKGKHATALFEVIKQAKQAPGARIVSTDVPATASLWFRSKDKSSSPSPIVNRAIAAPSNSPSLTAGVVTTSGTVLPDAPAMMEVPDPGTPMQPSAADQDAFAEYMNVKAASATSDATDLTRTEAIAAAIAPQRESSHGLPRARGMQCSVDQDRQQIAIHLSYKSAFVAVLGIGAALAMATIVGRSIGKSQSNELIVTTSEITAGPAFPDVLKNDRVGKDPLASPAPKAVPIPQMARTGTNQLPANPAPTKPAVPDPSKSNSTPNTTVLPAQPKIAVAPTPTPNNPLGVNLNRVVGQNYIIVQSYPDEKGAQDAASYLAKAGIPASVERVDYAPRWYSVVSTQGFERTSSGDGAKLIQAIKDIASAAPANNIARKFDPRPYRWRDAKSTGEARG